MEKINVAELMHWVKYVDWWMSLWNIIDLACYGTIFSWLIGITVFVIWDRRGN